MDWGMVDSIATAGLGVLFLMWADIIYGMSGASHFNAIALYLLIGMAFLIVGVGSIVALHGLQGQAAPGQTQLDRPID